MGRVVGSWLRRPRRVIVDNRLFPVLVLGVVLVQQGWPADRPVDRGVEPSIPESARQSATGPIYLDLPVASTAPLYLSPTEGGLIYEWPGGTIFARLGMRFDDGHVGWLLLRDPVGNAGWMAEIYLGERHSAADPPLGDEDYLGPGHWNGPITYCINPDRGPPGLDGTAFVALVERVSARWQEVTDDVLPLVSRGRCAHDATAFGDGVNTIGWVDDLGLAIAAQAWPDIRDGIMYETDIRLSRGYFLRLREREPAKTLERCVFSTLVHEMGHLLGLDHPGSRSLASSMQGFGAAACDKGWPSAADRSNLLRRYAR